jgi:hypothetical protein
MGYKAKIISGVIVGLAVGALMGSLGITWLFPMVDTGPIDNATKAVLVTALVEERPIRDIYSISAQVSEPIIMSIMPNGTAAEREVISGKIRRVGEAVHYGEVVAEVSGRPVFAMPSSLPLYRDMFNEITGSDVYGLQQMLTDIGLYQGLVDGRMGLLTLRAISELYTRAGYSAPDPVGLVVSNTVSLPRDGLVVARVAAVGSLITDNDNPLIAVVLSPSVITARVDLLQAEAFPVGTEVRVKVGSLSPRASTVVTVGEFQVGSPGTPPGYDVTVAVPDGIDSKEAAQQPVIISESMEVPTSLAVPLAAIRCDSTGASYVLLPPSKAGETPSVPNQVPVTVI